MSSCISGSACSVRRCALHNTIYCFRWPSLAAAAAAAVTLLHSAVSQLLPPLLLLLVLLLFALASWLLSPFTRPVCWSMLCDVLVGVWWSVELLFLTSVLTRWLLLSLVELLIIYYFFYYYYCHYCYFCRDCCGCFLNVSSSLFVFSLISGIVKRERRGLAICDKLSLKIVSQYVLEAEAYFASIYFLAMSSFLLLVLLLFIEKVYFVDKVRTPCTYSELTNLAKSCHVK